MREIIRIAEPRKAILVFLVIWPLVCLLIGLSIYDGWRLSLTIILLLVCILWLLGIAIVLGKGLIIRIVVLIFAMASVSIVLPGGVGTYIVVKNSHPSERIITLYDISETSRLQIKLGPKEERKILFSTEDIPSETWNSRAILYVTYEASGFHYGLVELHYPQNGIVGELNIE